MSLPAYLLPEWMVQLEAGQKCVDNQFIYQRKKKKIFEEMDNT